VGYSLEAVIGDAALLRARTRDLAEARLGALEHGLALLPITDELFDDVTDGTDGAYGFWHLPGGFEHELARWSAAGPVAYVEADYFGGIGGQQAVVWSGGRLVLGPLRLSDDAPYAPGGTPISRALRALGVTRGAAEDEFAAAGLTRHRRTEDWTG
jgi:hypothetical protein